MGETGKCVVRASPSGQDTWLQLNLFAQEELEAFRVNAMCIRCSSGLRNFEVWVSDDYQQDYTDPSQRCFAGEAATTGWLTIYQPCRAMGRFIRLRLVANPTDADSDASRVRTLRLVLFEVLSETPSNPPSKPVPLGSLHRLRVEDIQAATFPLTGLSAHACVDGNATTLCGYDATLCGEDEAGRNDGGGTSCVSSVRDACAEFPDAFGAVQACTAAAQTAVAVECGQGTADDPYLDIRLESPQALRAVSLLAPSDSLALSHFRLESGSDTDRLEPCLTLEGHGTADHVADHMGGPFVHECHDDDASVVRLTLPGRARQLQLKDVELYVDDFESPLLPPSPLPPPPSPPPPAVNIGVDAAEDSLRASLLNAISEATDGIAVKLQLSAGNHTLSEPIRLEASALRMSELFIVADQGAVIDLQPVARRRNRRLSGQTEAASAMIFITGATTVHLQGLTFRGAAGVSAICAEAGAIVMIDRCKIDGTVAPTSALVVRGPDASVHVSNSTFVNNSVVVADGERGERGAGGALLVTDGGSVVVGGSTFEVNRALRGGAIAVMGANSSLRLDDSRLEDNHASLRGGGLHVSGGTVVLASGTLITGNFADEGGTVMHVEGGTAAYELPAPLGRWISTASGAPIALGAHEGTYPHSCPPGIFGSSSASSAQLSPQCEGACPAGSECPGATYTPQLCPKGLFCPQGSAVGTPCPSGRYSEREGLQSEAECEECILGSWCSSGHALRCGVSTFNSNPGASAVSACTACPESSVTQDEGATSSDWCLCDEGFFESSRDAETGPVCVVCPVGSECAEVGTTLGSLPLERGYWRTSNASDDLRRCPDASDESSGCVGGVGGVGEGPCKPWLEGPYCKLCNITDRSRYYSNLDSACLPCEEVTPTPFIALVALVVFLLAVAALWYKYTPHRTIGWLRRGTERVLRLYAQLALRAKLKMLCSFYQVATRVSSIYTVPMPRAVSRLLSPFEALSLNIGDVGIPLQCLGLGRFEQQLLFMMLAPALLAAIVLASSVAFALLRRKMRSLPRARRLESGLVEPLPGLLLLSFLVFPSVSSLAFRAFDCEEFDDGSSFLRADYAIECAGAEYDRVTSLGWLAILLYPVGISLLYGALLYAARDSIGSERPTKLSLALSLLHRDYEPQWFWWELVETWRKLVLVGFFALVLPGTLEQAIIAFIFSLVMLLIGAITFPFRNIDDDYFAHACGFCLTALFFFSIILKVGVLVEAVDDVLTEQHRATYALHTDILAVCMMITVLGALAVASALGGRQVWRVARQPTIRLVETHSSPVQTLEPGKLWHTFLSHIWGTGQDQCATIKRQLCLLMPKISVFLDVDDLEDIGALEEYIDRSQVILIFVSKGYFKSGNCLREARHAVAQVKPLTLVRDGDRAQMALADIKRGECPDDLLRPIFDGREVIEWHRMKDFQLVSLKMIAEQILLGSPEYWDRAALPLYVPGEITRRNLAFRGLPTLFISRFNPGAAKVSAVLQTSMPGLKTTVQLPSDEPNDGTEFVSSSRFGTMLSKNTTLRRRTPQSGQPTHVMLYLAEHTWVGDPGQHLAGEVRRARAIGLPFVLLHENDMDNGGCEFSRFFATTPKDLIKDGLYRALALPFYPGGFRSVSIALVASALGATPVAASCSSVLRGGSTLHPIRPELPTNAVAPTTVVDATLAAAGDRDVSLAKQPPRRLVKAQAAMTIQRHQRGHAARKRAARFYSWRSRQQRPHGAPSAGEGGDAEGTERGGGIKDFVAWMMFERYDVTGDGHLGRDELSLMCVALGKGLSTKQLQEAMDRLDKDGDGLISFAEFHTWWEGGMSMDALLDAEYSSEVAATTKRLRRMSIEARERDESGSCCSNDGKRPSQVHTSHDEERHEFLTERSLRGTKDKPDKVRRRSTVAASAGQPAEKATTKTPSSAGAQPAPRLLPSPTSEALPGSDRVAASPAATADRPQRDSTEGSVPAGEEIYSV